MRKLKTALQLGLSYLPFSITKPRICLNLRPMPLCLAIGISLLSACDETSTTATSTPTAVGPGPYAVNVIDAAVMFGRVCAQSYPSLSKARAAVLELPFVQDPRTGTYFHQNLDLSFKLTDSSGAKFCSMVFGSKEKDSTLVGITVATSVPTFIKGASDSLVVGETDGSVTVRVSNSSNFFVQPTIRSNGRNYYAARITNFN